MDINKDKIKCFTANKFSMNDYLLVSKYFKQGELNEGLKKCLQEDWDEISKTSLNKKDLNYLLDRIHHKINLNNTSRPRLFKNLYRSFSKIAAVLILPALITIAAFTYFTFNNGNKVEPWAEIYSPVGARTKFQLPDGSEGWLNSGSSIKYSTNFTKNRVVEVSGEAWFDVVHQKAHDFRVVTPYFDVKVLGTQFNVIAYNNEETAEVILEEGKVIVLGKDQEVKGELIPNQHFIYNKSTKEVLKTNINSKVYTSWKDGVLIFKNEPMSEIAKRLGRKYNADIILHGDSLKSSIFRATFQDEGLDEICKLLSTVAPIEYKIHKRYKQTNGAFTKYKVDIWLKK